MSEIPSHSIFGSLREYAGQIGTLVRLDLAMLQAETAASAKSALTGVALSLAAGIFAMFGILFFALAAFFGLMSAGLSALLASLAVGGAFMVVGGILALVAARCMRSASLVPRRTMTQVCKDIQALKASISGVQNAH